MADYYRTGTWTDSRIMLITVFSGVAIILPYYDYVSYAVPITYLKDTELLNDTHESHYVYDPTIMDWSAASMAKECYFWV